jgi:histone-lysine N-methyltransferase SETDB1
MSDEIIRFMPHPCTPTCVAKWETSVDRVKFINPLLMPMLHGWQRHLYNQSKAQTRVKWVNYMTPCGRVLRSTGEIDRYLYMTDSRLTIDMFSFDYFINTDREFEANARFLQIADISFGKENMPISCVNCVDGDQPDDFEYSAHRRPLNGVPLNTHINNMEGCDCEDNCRDHMKCACWRKTFEATTFISDDMNTNVGYKKRRLNNPVI